MTLLSLAAKSLANRRFTSILTVSTIALSVLLLLGVERMRTEAREAFTSTVSGTDLIVGARTGAVQLLLYSVFHIGSATNNITWQSYRDIAALPGVAWTVPISLGDSHRGHRVMGTEAAFFEHYRYARDRRVAFAAGSTFDDLYDAVLGAEVAARLGYRIGEALVIAHGAGSASVLDHGDKPFRVAGILERTGTPVDRTVIVSLAGIEAIHADWAGGVPVPGRRLDADAVRELDLAPDAITAALVGLSSRVHTFRVQRLVNEYPEEPLLAILPGVTLAELWNVMGVVEGALMAISVLVVLVGLGGMVTALVTGLNERRREIAVLRSVGARPWQVLGLLVVEAMFLAAAGIVIGLLLLYAVIGTAGGALESHLGFSPAWRMPGLVEWLMLGGVLAAALLAGLVPGMRAYRYSLSDGLALRL